MVEEYSAEDYNDTDEISDSISTSVFSYLPSIFSENTSDKLINKYIAAHDNEFEGFGDATKYVKQSKYVNSAEGDDLENVGRLYGVLGNKGTRNNSEYRDFVTNLINSFNARGTKPGLKFAISAAANIDPDNVTIEEDFVNNEYEIVIESNDTDGFIGGEINDLALLADPSGVELSSPPIIITDGDSITVLSTGTTVTNTEFGLGGDTLTMDGNSSLQ